MKQVFLEKIMAVESIMAELEEDFDYNSIRAAIDVFGVSKVIEFLVKWQMFTIEFIVPKTKIPDAASFQAKVKWLWSESGLDLKAFNTMFGADTKTHLLFKFLIANAFIFPKMTINQSAMSALMGLSLKKEGEDNEN